MSSQYSDLIEELTRLVRTVAASNARLEQIADELEKHFTERLNEAYQQGVRDARKARTGRDPVVENHA